MSGRSLGPSACRPSSCTAPATATSAWATAATLPSTSLLPSSWSCRETTTSSMPGTWRRCSRRSRSSSPGRARWSTTTACWPRCCSPTSVGSTEHATRLGDRAWRDLLERHDTAVRQELGRFRGREIHTTGDGFFATFDGPARAVRCALAIRGALRPLGLEIRTGLHTGECELRGDDVSGIAVHIGARVAAAANAGEVLVSGTLKDLVTGSGLRFVERGVPRLKGVGGEWPLHAAE